MIKDIFFDLDHTLWDFHKNSEETLKDLFGVSLLHEKQIAFEHFFKTYNTINDALWKDYRDGKIGKTQLRKERFERTLRSFGVNDPNLVEYFNEGYIKESPLKKNLIPGTHQLLDHLKDCGYAMHIITNGFTEVQFTKLEKTGLRPYFQEVITSDAVGANKPDIKIFTHALQAAGAKRKSSIMVGDHLIADILGAKRAGLKQGYFNPNRTPHSEKITLEFAALPEFSKLIKKIDRQKT